jgi:predicted fused transcriptional regulator/phosphomethylpyrimidine kinase
MWGYHFFQLQGLLVGKNNVALAIPRRVGQASESFVSIAPFWFGSSTHVGRLLWTVSSQNIS